MNPIRFKVLAAVAMAFALVFAPISANAYTPTAPDGGERTVAPGASFTVTFTGFEPGESVFVTLTGEGIGPANLAALKAAPTSASVNKVANASGNVPVSVTIPESAQPGETFTVLAEGELSGSATYTIFIEDASGSGGDESDEATGSLTRTDGSLSPAILAGGAVLLLAGAGIVLVARRKSKTSDWSN